VPALLGRSRHAVPALRGARPLPCFAAVLALVLGGCASTVQDQPIAHNILESLVVAPYPVYWLGGSFRGWSITEASRDPGGASTIQYGDCLEGGQGVCVPPVRVVTSPDNSFVPGGATPRAIRKIRGVKAVLTEEGRTIEIPTGRVIVDIYAQSPRVASAAAETIVPINAVGPPSSALPPRLPVSEFAQQPLPVQMPAPLHSMR